MSDWAAPKRAAFLFARVETTGTSKDLGQASSKFNASRMIVEGGARTASGEFVVLYDQNAIGVRNQT